MHHTRSLCAIRSPVQEHSMLGGYPEWLITWPEEIKGQIKERHWWEGWTKDGFKGVLEWRERMNEGCIMMGEHRCWAGRRNKFKRENSWIFHRDEATKTEGKMKRKVKGRKKLWEQRMGSRSWERFPKKIRYGRWAPISQWPECRKGRSTRLRGSPIVEWRSHVFYLCYDSVWTASRSSSSGLLRNGS